jgi:hypothetical protein
MWMTRIGPLGPDVIKVNPIASGWSPILGELTIGWEEDFNQFSGPTLRMTGAGTFEIEPGIQAKTATFNPTANTEYQFATSSARIKTESFRVETNAQGSENTYFQTTGKPLHFLSGDWTDSVNSEWQLLKISTQGVELFHKPSGTSAASATVLLRTDESGIALPQIANAPLLKTGAGGVIERGALDSLTSPIPSADVAIGTSWTPLSADLSLTAGKWLIHGMATVLSDTNHADVGVRLYNETDAEYLASTDIHIEHGGHNGSCHLSAVVTLTGTRTIAFEAICPDTATGNANPNGTGSVGIRFEAVRIG